MANVDPISIRIMNKCAMFIVCVRFVRSNSNQSIRFDIFAGGRWRRRRRWQGWRRQLVCGEHWRINPTTTMVYWRTTRTISELLYVRMYECVRCADWQVWQQHEQQCHVHSIWNLLVCCCYCRAICVHSMSDSDLIYYFCSHLISLLGHSIDVSSLLQISIEIWYDQNTLST